jgi:hypothetical protein
MITASDELASVIAAGGFSRHYVADVIVDGVRVLTDVPLASCELTSRGSAQIRNQGSAVFHYSDELGTSIIPEDLTSWLTPYATYLNISMRVAVGDFSEKVLRGSFKIVGVSDPSDQTISLAGRLITLNSKVRLRLADAFAVTQREDFPAPGGPASLTSVWDELGRVSGLALLRNVTDAAISREVVYQQSRLTALFDLARILEGAPYVNPAGQLTLQPDVWGAETEPLLVGESGTITRVNPDDLTDEGIYNQVVVRSFAEDQTVVLATAEVEDGPLRYGGPFGRIPYFASSEFVTTEVDAQAYADSLLPKVSSVRAAPYLIQCLPDPRREVGDVVPFTTTSGLELVGRIDEITLPDTGLMAMKALIDRG